jgi:hypothetical protein
VCKTRCLGTDLDLLVELYECVRRLYVPDASEVEVAQRSNHLDSRTYSHPAIKHSPSDIMIVEGVLSLQISVYHRGSNCGRLLLPQFDTRARTPVPVSQPPRFVMVGTAQS